MKWKDTNQKYVSEGELCLDFDFLKTWQQELVTLNKNKKGGQYQYPDSLFQFCSVQRAIFGLHYRQHEGILKSLKKWVPIPSVPNYSQIQRRVTKLGLSLVDSLEHPEDGQIIAIDSSGIKLYNSGQWIREKHKKKGPFLKLHIAVNIKEKQVVAIRITEDNVGDNKMALHLIDDARKIASVAKGLFDGAYDAYSTWNGLQARYIKPLIRLRKNAVVNKNRSKVRSKAVQICRDFEMKWPKETGYGQRWQAETWFSSYKRRFGECCSATKPENVVKEIMLKVILCNQMIL
jgi:hypothetical protein